MPRIPPDDSVLFPATDATSSETMTTLFRVMGHRPDIMRHAMELLNAAMRTGSVEAKLKELLAIRVSQVNHCFY